jgi:hypothetical protein
VKETLKSYEEYALTAANTLKEQLVVGNSLLTEEKLRSIEIPLGPASDLVQAIEQLKAPAGIAISFTLFVVLHN